MALLIGLAPQPHCNHNIPDDVLIEDRETEYVGLILEDRTVIIESFDVDDDVERTLSKVNDKKVIGFVHGLDDDEVPTDKILDAFDKGCKTYEEYYELLDEMSLAPQFRFC